MSRLVLTVLVRVAALGGGITVYYLLLPVLFRDDGGGANIGAGLIAFGLIVLASAVWGFFDGVRFPLATVVLTWVAASLLVAVVWAIGLAVNEADASVGVLEQVRTNLDLVPFAIGLVLVPALAAGAIGRSVGAGRRTDGP